MEYLECLGFLPQDQVLAAFLFLINTHSNLGFVSIVHVPFSDLAINKFITVGENQDCGCVAFIIILYFCSVPVCYIS